MREKRKNTPRYIDWSQLPDENKTWRLAPSRKRLLDTVKLIAYRAETAMMIIAREVLSREDHASSLLRGRFRTNADITPDIACNVLRVSVHGMANPRSNVAIRHLLDTLDAADCTFPATNLKLEFSLLGTPSQHKH